MACQPKPRRRLAEGVGFEPTSPFGEAVFKTAALNHSAIPPFLNSVRNNLVQSLELRLKICFELLTPKSLFFSIHLQTPNSELITPKLFFLLYPLHPKKIGPQDFRDDHASVALLIIL